MPHHQSSPGMLLGKEQESRDQVLRLSIILLLFDRKARYHAVFDVYVYSFTFAALFTRICCDTS